MPACTFSRFLLAALMVGSLLVVPPNESIAAVVEWSGDTVISDDRAYTADHITVEGNLTISGRLTLVGTELEIDCPSCGTYAIDVRDGGSLNILSGSRIAATNPDAHYLLRVWPGSTLSMNDSKLQDCGWGSNYTIPASDRGLYVNASAVSVTNSTISGNHIGIIIDNCSRALVQGNNLSANEAGGILIFGGSSPVIDNNIITCNNGGVSGGADGISCSDSFPIITNNTISHNGYTGIDISNGKADILYNRVLGSVTRPFTQGIGVNLRRVDANIFGNNCSGNTIGLKLYMGSSTVLENTFNDNVGDTIVVGDGYGVEDGSSSKFANNSYSGNQCGICLNGCTSTFRNETINSSRRGAVEYYEQSRAFSAVMTDCGFSKNGQDVKLQRLFGGGQGGTLEIVNPITNNLYVSVTEPLATLKVWCYLDAEVIYENGSLPVPGALVSVADAFGANAALLTTGTDGRTARVLLESYRMTGSGSSFKTPFNITAIKDGRSNFTADVSLNCSRNATVILDDIPPAVAIGHPANGLLTNRKEVFVTGKTERWVSLLVNDAPVNVDANGDWSVDVPLQKEGANEIRAEVEDGGNNRATDAITVFRDTIAPVLEITAPMENLLTNLSSVAVAGTVSDPSAGLTLNGQNVTVGSGGVFSAEAGLAEGANTLTLECRDAAGNRGSATRTVLRDTIPPMLVLLRPQNGLLTSKDSVSVSGSADTDCELTMNGQPVALDQGRFTVEARLDEGANSLVFAARDRAGNWNQSRLSVFRDSTPPVLDMTFPPDGALLNTSVVEVRGTTEPGAVVTLNGNPVTLDGNSFSVVLSLAEGENTITLEALDALENTARKTAVVFVDTIAPPLTIKSPADRSLTNRTALELRGFTESESSLTVNGAPVRVESSGAFNCTVELELEGANLILVRAADAANNTATARLTIVRDTLVWYNITSPDDGERTTEAAVYVKGRAEPGGSISIRGIPVFPGTDGTFSQAVALAYGPNIINITITDQSGNSVTRTLNVTRLRPATPAPAGGLIPGFSATAAFAAAASAIIAVGAPRRKRY